MAKPNVVYTDPMWAIGPGGSVEPERAAYERGVLGESIEMRFGAVRNGTYIREGPELLEAVRGANALVIFRTQVTRELLDVVKATCKVIGRQGVGFDNLNVPLLQEYGIYGFNVPDYGVDEVSNHAMALVLAHERRICGQNEQVKGNRWATFGTPLPRRLNDLTFGVLGLGRIGRATARKAQAFYKRIVAYDPYVHEDLMAGLGIEKTAGLHAFMAQCDTISIHAPLDEETRHMINAASLAHAKARMLVVNTARGDIIEPEAMLHALRSGRIGGYASDVFHPEDPNAHPANRELLAFENVIVSAHAAAYSDVAARSMRVRCAQEVAHVLLTGEPPQFGRLA